MKIKIAHTWEWDQAEEKEFNTLEELIDFAKKEQLEGNTNGLILYYEEDKDEWTGEIYDMYRE